MKSTRIIVAALVLAAPFSARAAEGEDKAFGHLLTLMQTFTSIAAQSNRPERDFADVLAGKDERVNRAASGLVQEITSEIPPAYRSQMQAIGADLVAIARRGASLPIAAMATPSSPIDALQARKDLTAMGLKYHDSAEFLDAVRRDDALAVELFVAGRGVNLSSTDWRGRSALEIARSNGNDRIASLLAKNLPAAR